MIKSSSYISRFTGEIIDEHEHIKESIITILTTKIGSRIMRREFGSLYRQLIDQPLNEVTYMMMQTIVQIALTLYEPRVDLQIIRVDGDIEGRIEVEIDGLIVSNNRRVEYLLPMMLNQKGLSYAK